MKTKLLLASAAALAFTSLSAQAEKWDMALAYSATNFHSEAAAEFARGSLREKRRRGSRSRPIHPAPCLADLKFSGPCARGWCQSVSG